MHKLQHIARLLLCRTTWIFILLLCGLISVYSQPQQAGKFIPKTTRILFVLDGSGSMRDAWDDSDRWEVSKKLLQNMIDSLHKANPDIQIGIRVFGHQSPRTAKNCTDSKLEIPFAEQNQAAIKAKLASLTPQGWTPIAYSLFRAAEDFPPEPGVQNAIVLITDGLETCGGDICAAGQMLADKKISVRPFIIGLGLKKEEQTYFDCLGDYYDASSEQRFKDVLSLVVSQALNNTTTQLYLLDANGNPTETDVPISLYDHHSGVLLYNFVHTLNSRNQPDTLWLDPAGRYDVQVHSFPPVEKKGVQLKPGVHNTVKIPCAQGTLKLTDNIPNSPVSSVQCLVLDPNSNRTLNLQLVNTEKKYLQGSYKVEILTLPRIRKTVAIQGGKETAIAVPKPGTLQVITGRKGIGGIYQMHEGALERVYEFGQLQAKETLYLQPGEYFFVVRWDDKKKSEFTERVPFQINSGATKTLRY